MEPTTELAPAAIYWCRELGAKSVVTVDDVLVSPHSKEYAMVTRAIQKGINRANEKATSHAQKIQKWILLKTDLNNGIRNEAINVIKSSGPGGLTNNGLQKLNQLLNSVPANLRYGVAGVNRGIGSHLDPMGTIKRKLTTKDQIYATGKKVKKGVLKKFNFKALSAPRKLKKGIFASSSNFGPKPQKQAKDVIMPISQ